MPLNREQIQNMFRGVFKGSITLENLPDNLYLAIAERLEKGLFQGYGSNLSNTNLAAANKELLTKLRTNIYEFSAAKTFQQVRAAQEFIFDNKGFKRAFREFEKDAQKVFDLYNKTWLKTEYNTTISQADSAARWRDIEDDKQLLPFLKYQTVGDARVREDHAELDGVIKPVDDPFWDTFMPPLGWNCRCEVVQEDTMTNAQEKRSDSKIADIKRQRRSDPDLYNQQFPKMFRNNPGKTGNIFDESKHPYFKVPRRYDQLKKNNFNLRKPE